MSRILLVGQGPLPERASRYANAHVLRTSQFLSALRHDGHDVKLVLLVPGPELGEPDRASAASYTRSFASQDALREHVAKVAADAAVAASGLASYLLATSSTGVPMWLDLNGDPCAEGQAQAAVESDDRAVENSIWLLHEVLRRGDRFSAISARHRDALLGQLGLCGRLSRSAFGHDLVEIVPEGLALPADPSRRPADVGHTALFSGSLASWVDDDTLFDALELAFGELDQLRFAVTGGPTAGYLEARWERFRRQLDERLAGHRSRIDVHGWLEESKLEEIEDTACCGLIPERRCAERELGGLNRILRWMARGVPVICTPLTDIGAEVERLALGLPYRPGDPRSLADAILRLAREPQLGIELAQRARDWLGETRSLLGTTASLRRWAAAPVAAPDRLDGSAHRLARRFHEIVRDQTTIAASRSEDGADDVCGTES